MTKFHAILRAAVLALAVTVGLPAAAATPATSPAKKPQTAAPKAQVPPDAWPREIKLASAVVLVYQPQVTGWSDNRIEFRSALAIRPSGAKEETFGVVFATASTHVDRVARTVVFADLKITKSDFPTLPDHGAAYTAELQKQLAGGMRMIALDRLAASLAAAGVKPKTVAVENNVPRVIVSNTPAILVPVDGAPVVRPVPDGGGFQRVINTRALILKSPKEPQFFLRVYDGWMMALSLDGPWEQPFIAPAGIDVLAKKIAATGAVDLLDGGPRANPKPSLAQGLPAIYVAQTPAELVTFQGAPDFAPIVGTGLQWATNTTSDVLRLAATGDYYVLLAGRWFRAAALTGPWTFVASDALPADFARIPPTSLAAAVLPTVAGTPQSREAVIEISIPQTATVPLKDGPAFTAKFDGPPQFAPVPGTALSYAVNAPVPVIQTAPNAFYTVKAGVWFTAAQATGPWSIATAVPPAIYGIPPSSPIFYATYVRIYGASADAVFTGYTPGYLGAMVSPAGTVVYGTGYNYTPWIGNAWYAAPATYGVAAAPVYNPRVGYTYAFSVGLGTVAWTQPFLKGAQLHPDYWGVYPCCASASANVYKYWAHAVTSKSRAKGPGGGKAQRATAAAPAGAAPVAVNAPAAAPVRAPAPATAPTRITNANAMMPPPMPAPTAAHPYIVAPPRGYDMSMVTTQDSPYTVRPAAPPAGASQYISANAYYASLGQNGNWKPESAANNTYADDGGNVYRQTDSGWQQHSPNGWTSAPAAPAAVKAEASARSRGEAAAMQAGSYSMSNTSRFTGDQGDGWTARDSGDGGYSRTLGGDGGISAERWAYNDAVLNNEFDIAANGGWWGDGVYIGGIGWGGRFGD